MRGEIQDIATQNVPTRTSSSLGAAGCGERCTARSLPSSSPAPRKASGRCWQGRVASIWGDSYCWRKGEKWPPLAAAVAALSLWSHCRSGKPWKRSEHQLVLGKPRSSDFHLNSAQWGASERKLIDSSSFSETFMLIQYRLLMEFPFSEKISTSIEK